MLELIDRCKNADLVAILCNPPMRDPSLTRSWANLAILRDALNARTVTICNLIEVQSRSSEELGHLTGTVDTEDLSRRIKAAADGSSVAVAAWGTNAPSGWRVRHWADVVNSTLTGLSNAGHSHVAHVGPGTRHPSRWTQYTSPVHKRFDGPTFPDRLIQSLRWSPVTALAR
ncbi:hypothetical protein RN2511_047900 [Rhodococcus sp. NKCM2511]|nr:hypothetical protein RN2511_047900 [Rhodococcus sp. NKCM2511]